MSSFHEESLAGMVQWEYVNRQNYIFIAHRGSDLFLNNETQTACSYVSGSVG